jgi:hypothetical protein
MGCLFALFAGIFPRLALFILWIARPERIDAAFDTFLWPLLGIIFQAQHVVPPEQREAGKQPAGLLGG